MSSMIPFDGSVLPRAAEAPDRLAELRRRAMVRLLEEEAALAAMPGVSRRWAVKHLALAVGAAALFSGHPAEAAAPGPRSTAPQYGAPVIYGNPPVYKPARVLGRDELGSPEAWSRSNTILVEPGSKDAYVFSASVPSRTALFRLGSGRELSLSALADALSHRNYIVNADAVFAVPDGNDLWTALWGEEELILMPSVFRARDVRGVDETIASFAAAMDDKAIERAVSPTRGVHIALTQGVPAGFWDDDAKRYTAAPVLYRASSANGLLKLGCSSGATSGTFVIDLHTKKLVSFQHG